MTVARVRSRGGGQKIDQDGPCRWEPIAEDPDILPEPFDRGPEIQIRRQGPPGSLSDPAPIDRASRGAREERRDLQWTRRGSSEFDPSLPFGWPAAVRDREICLPWSDWKVLDSGSRWRVRTATATVEATAPLAPAISRSRGPGFEGNESIHSGGPLIRFFIVLFLIVKKITGHPETVKMFPLSESLNTPRPAFPPGRFEKEGAGLEPKKQYGKPFRRDLTATKICFRLMIAIN